MPWANRQTNLDYWKERGRQKKEAPNARSTRLRAERKAVTQASCGAVPEPTTLEQKSLL